jgi:MFS family permease
MFIVGISLYSIRLVAMSLTHSPWVILLLQLMHGLTFATTWVAGVAYADQIAPPGLGATAQGLFSAFLVGLGAGTGALVGGILYGQYGAPLMYRIIGILLFASLVLFLLASQVKRRAMQSI